MKKVVIVFHSVKGHTRALAQEIQYGAMRVLGVEATLVDLGAPRVCPWGMLAEADAMIFGSPTFMGTVSAPFKQFMDDSGDFWLEQPWRNKLAAGFTIATSPSGDKLGTLSTLMLCAMQHGMVWVGLDLVGSIHTKDNLELNSDGSMLGLMARSNPDKTKKLFEGDTRTAHHFGERVALMTKSFQAIPEERAIIENCYLLPS